MAQYEDFSIDQGTDVTVRLTLTELDNTPKIMTGIVPRAQIRKTFLSSDSDAVTFSASIFGADSDGIIDLDLTNAQTAAMKEGSYVYDVELLDSDAATIERVLEGRVKVNPRVTRIP